jgi:DNA-binding sugar fermentation-stimulating protein
MEELAKSYMDVLTKKAKLAEEIKALTKQAKELHAKLLQAMQEDDVESCGVAGEGDTRFVREYQEKLKFVCGADDDDDGGNADSGSK